VREEERWSAGHSGEELKKSPHLQILKRRKKGGKGEEPYMLYVNTLNRAPKEIRENSKEKKRAGEKKPPTMK